jgi:hypothetical protein
MMMMMISYMRKPSTGVWKAVFHVENDKGGDG